MSLLKKKSLEMKKKNCIYLDYNSTTPVAPVVYEVMDPYWKEFYGNPSSLHQMGQASRRAIDEAREIIAGFLNAKAHELIFTSCGTEANNLVLLGSLQAQENPKPHWVISGIEHPSILDAAQSLAKDERIQLKIVYPNSKGLISADEILSQVNDETTLVSLMHVNNETGVLQPISEVGEALKKKGVHFHVDAIQSFGKLELDIEKINCDSLSISGHKIYGPKGIAMLYIRANQPIKAIFRGGHQENNIRPGTENPALIRGLGEACRFAYSHLNDDCMRLQSYKLKMIERLSQKIPSLKINGDVDQCLYNTLNIAVEEVDGTSLMMALDLQGICVSTGSACTLGSTQASHVLLAMGLDEKQAKSSIRVSLGHFTKEEEVDQFIHVFPKVVDQVRSK